MTIQSSCLITMEKMVVVHHHHHPAAVFHSQQAQQPPQEQAQQQQQQQQQQQHSIIMDDDDESSLCSTVCVESPTKFSNSNSNSSEETERQRIRVVSFGSDDEDGNGFQYYENHLYAQEDAVALWYSTQEYQNFKAAASFMSKMIDKAEGGSPRDPLSYIGILENAYHDCCLQQQQLYPIHSSTRQETTTTTTTSDEESFQQEGRRESYHDKDAGGIQQMKQQLRLKQLFRVEIGLGRLGLERRCVRFVAQDKSRRRNDLIRLIKQHDRQRKNNNNNITDREELRKQCESISYVSRLFAHRLAEAQASDVV